MQAIASAIIVLWGWRRFAVALVAGALSALAFAPFDLFPILWLTVPVFVWLIDGSEAGEGASWWRKLVPAAVAGFAFGFGFFVAGLWWIGTALLVDPGFAWALPLAVAGLPAVLALFWAFGAALARAFWADGWPRLLVFAVAMSTAEWLRGHLFTGFPWNAFGYALTPAPMMMQTASLGGIWSLTLAAFFIFAAPALLVADRRRTRRASRVAFAAAAALYLFHVGYGVVRLSAGPVPLVPGVSLRIVQPSIPQDERWESASADTIMARYADLSRNGAKSMTGVTHLIWPESAFPFLLTEKPSALTTIADLLPPGTVLFTGAARAERVIGSDDPPMVFNSIYAIDDGGEIRAAYDKVHLVPFGEYLPFGGLLRAIGLRQVIALPGGFSPGQTLRTLSLPGAPPFAPLICYEIIFPGAVIAEGEPRPQWMLNVTNDAWYGATPGPYQHFEQARVRAVEEGLPLVRAANSGVSAIVDPYGRVLASLALDKIGVVDGGLPTALPPTLYSEFGDWIFLALMILAMAGAAFGQRNDRFKVMTDN